MESPKNTQVIVFIQNVSFGNKSMLSCAIDHTAWQILGGQKKKSVMKKDDVAFTSY